MTGPHVFEPGDCVVCGKYKNHEVHAARAAAPPDDVFAGVDRISVVQEPDSRSTPEFRAGWQKGYGAARATFESRAFHAAAPPVEPRSDPEDGPNPWEPAVPPPDPVAGLREAIAAWFRRNGTCFTYDDIEKHRGLPDELAGQIVASLPAALLDEPVPLDVERLLQATDGLDHLISDILRSYGGTMKGRGDHAMFDALVRFRKGIKAARLTDLKGATDGE